MSEGHWQLSAGDKVWLMMLAPCPPSRGESSQECSRPTGGCAILNLYVPYVSPSRGVRAASTSWFTIVPAAVGSHPGLAPIIAYN